MDKRAIPENIKIKIGKYINLLKADDLPIDKVYLFGSFAKGTFNKWSDIDICIVSSKFTNLPDTLEYLNNKATRDDLIEIEAIGYNPNDMEDKYNSLISEIKNNGIEISHLDM